MRKKHFRGSLITRVIAVFLVCNLLYVVMISVLSSIQEKNNAEEYNRKNLQEIVKEKSQLISSGFAQVEWSAKSSGIWYQKVIKEKSSINYSSLPDAYEINSDGTITSKEKDQSKSQQSVVYVSNKYEKSNELYNDIVISEEINEEFSEIVKNEVIPWAYIVTKRNLLRCAPYSDLKKRFSSSHDQTKDDFYIQADETHNPAREMIWTKPYIDYLNTGWTMTCSYPLYDNQDSFYGVISVDLSLTKVIKKYFKDFNLGEKCKIYWISKTGDIYYQEDMEKIERTQGKIFNKNFFNMSNIKSGKKEIFKKLLKEGEGVYFYEEGDKRKIIFGSTIKENNSILMIDIDESELLKKPVLDPAILLMTLMVAVSISFVIISWLKYNFSKPIKRLVHEANFISNGDYSHIESTGESNFTEIIELERAFDTMNRSIERYVQSLKEKNSEIETIMETIDGILMIVDTCGNILTASKETEILSEDIIFEAFNKIKVDKKVLTEQLIIDGDVYKNTYYPILSGNGELEKMVVSSECITKSVLKEKEVQQIEKMAGIGQFAAAIVHELKNNLAVIKGASYILKLQSLGDTNDEEIKRIDRAVEESENVIETLLDYSRGEDDKTEMVHIGTIINQILLLSKKSLIRNNISVINKVDDSSYIELTSREALKVIIQNLILNAIQAVEKDGQIEVECFTTGRAHIIIKNNGKRISEDIRSKIFEPFFTTKKNGSGVGLWITKTIVDSLSGEIKVSEDENKKTVFEIILPLEAK